MSGVHALLRAPLDTVRRDAGCGRRTAGVVCGYRGSPLGTVDTHVRGARGRVRRPRHPVRQRRERGPRGDRALGHANGRSRSRPAPSTGWSGSGTARHPASTARVTRCATPTSPACPPTGGVLAAVGDDPECKSSTVPSSTEWTLADLAMPALAAGDGAGGARPRPPRLRDVAAERLVGGAEAPQRHRRRLRDRRRRPAARPRSPPYERDGRPWPAHLDDRMFAPWSMLLEEEAIGARLDAVHHYVRARRARRASTDAGRRASASSPPARPTATS